MHHGYHGGSLILVTRVAQELRVCVRGPHRPLHAWFVWYASTPTFCWFRNETHAIPVDNNENNLWTGRKTVTTNPVNRFTENVTIITAVYIPQYTYPVFIETTCSAGPPYTLLSPPDGTRCESQLTTDSRKTDGWYICCQLWRTTPSGRTWSSTRLQCSRENPQNGGIRGTEVYHVDIISDHSCTRKRFFKNRLERKNVNVYISL